MNKGERTTKLGRYIQGLRKDSGMNMVEASKKLSQTENHPFTRSQWNNWELGIREPSHHWYESLAKVLGTTRELLAWDFLKNGCNTSINQINRLSERGISRDDVIEHLVNDDTVSPEVKKGDILLINTSDKKISKAGLFAIKDNNGCLWIRWIRPELNGAVTVYCSDKSHYPDQVVTDLKTIEIIGAIVNINRWL